MAHEEREWFQHDVRQARGKQTQREFAARIGVTEQSVSSWELGKSIPSGLAVRRSLERIGITVPPVTSLHA